MTDAIRSESRHAERIIGSWLFTIAALVFVMVGVGGITRLTDSGLSITEWLPLLGAIPPLSDQDWALAFDKYRQIPEYHLINKGMSLEAFKFIYWWEWGHRQLGRFIGLAFFLPFVFFLWRGYISRSLIMPLIGLFILGGLQGVMGWYMVSSGLVDRVDVSQYRLVAHLGLALVIFAYAFWLGMRLHIYGDAVPHSGARVAFGGVLVALVFGQSLLGGFVAGTDAGMTYNSWPLLDGQWVPDALYGVSGTIKDAFEHHLTIQFNHRVMAYILILAVILEFLHCHFTPTDRRIRRSALALIGAVTVQAVIGILTVLHSVPLALGGLHQLGAVVLLAAALWHFFNLRYTA